MWNSRSPGVATAWRGPAPDFTERMQFRRTRLAKQPVPRVRAEAHHAGQLCLEVAECHGAQQRRQVAAESADGPAAGAVRIDSHDDKDRGARQGLDNRLRDRRQTLLVSKCPRRVRFHRTDPNATMRKLVL